MSLGIIEQPRFSCALAAQQTVLAIPRGIPIVHAGPGCSEKAFGFVSYGSGYQGEGYAGGGNISCTNTGEEEVIFGGEEKLRSLVESTLQVIDGDLFVILTGCTAGIIGDDVIAIAREFAEEGAPVVGAETSGFKGNNYFGHELVMREIINQYVGEATPHVREHTINVFSVVPFQDPFWRTDLEELKRLLQAIGLEVNILFGGGSRGVDEWKDIPNASFNLVISPWVGVKTAELLEEKYGTPFLPYPILPVGARATSQFLRTVGGFAHLRKERVEDVIRAEEKRFYDYFVSLGDFIVDLNNNIPLELYTVADSAYALGVSDYLVNEMGFSPQGIYLVDAPPAAWIPKIKQAFADIGDSLANVLEIEEDGGFVQQHLRQKIGHSDKAIILGSTWEANVARENNNLLVRLSLPINDDVIVNRSFVGYNGGLRLTEEIYSGIFRKGNISQSTQSLQ